MVRERVYHRKGKGKGMGPSANLVNAPVVPRIRCCSDQLSLSEPTSGHYGDGSTAKKGNNTIHVVPLGPSNPFTSGGGCEMEGVVSSCWIGRRKLMLQFLWELIAALMTWPNA